MVVLLLPLFQERLLSIYTSESMSTEYCTDLDNKTFSAYKCTIFSYPYFLAYVLDAQKTSQWDGSFEYQQHMFWLKNKKVIFLLCTLNYSPGTGLLHCLSLPRESVLLLTDHLNITITVDWDVKPQTKQLCEIYKIWTLCKIAQGSYFVHFTHLYTFNVFKSLQTFNVFKSL